MMASLVDAWQWYESARLLTRTVQRLSTKHWHELPWQGELGRDEHLKELDQTDLIARSVRVLQDLDDHCVVMLFSVFEAAVRTRILQDLKGEAASLRHPALIHAAESATEAIEQGSFFRVLEPYKGAVSQLVEEVHQVRRYRNLVSHGRRGKQPSAVSPKIAYERLHRFLAWLDGQQAKLLPPATA